MLSCKQLYSGYCWHLILRRQWFTRQVCSAQHGTLRNRTRFAHFHLQSLQTRSDKPWNSDRRCKPTKLTENQEPVKNGQNVLALLLSLIETPNLRSHDQLINSSSSPQMHQTDGNGTSFALMPIFLSEALQISQLCPKFLLVALGTPTNLLWVPTDLPVKKVLQHKYTQTSGGLQKYWRRPGFEHNLRSRARTSLLLHCFTETEHVVRCGRMISCFACNPDNVHADDSLEDSQSLTLFFLQ